MRAGIGPAEVLRNAGVDLFQELPVGESLHDHNGIILAVESDRELRSSQAGQRGKT